MANEFSRVSDLKQDDKNANMGNEKGNKKLVESLKNLKFGRSILVDRNGKIIAGNKTAQAAIDAGMGDIQIVETSGEALVVVKRNDLDLDDPDDTRARELAIADNRIGQLNLDWNPEVLLEQARQINLKDYFTDSELNKITKGKYLAGGDYEDGGYDKGEDGEPAGELLGKWEAQPGQVWKLGKHRLVCGDCRHEAVIEALFDGATARLCITDPPYGVEYDPDWRQRAAERGGIDFATRRTGEVANDDNSDWREVWAAMGAEVFYCWHASLKTAQVFESIESAGYEIRNQIIWVKPRFAISQGHYHWRHEPCFYAVKKGKTADWQGDRSQTTVWEIGLDRNVEGGHGTQKPLECMERPIRHHSGDVFDPFVGSGTTIIAAQRQGRRCFAVELKPVYVAACLERYQRTTGEEPVLDYVIQ